MDFNHAEALETKLKDCTDEQLIVELARRKVDIQHKVTADLVAKYYHFEKLLGHGASGKVYLVYHRESGEKFACKVIKKDGSMNDAQSMSTEIEIMKRCRHLNIVSLYELFESSVCIWLILELVEGTGLRGGVSNHAHYTEQVCARFVRQICMGLHYLHNMGVVHRDIKVRLWPAWKCRLSPCSPSHPGTPTPPTRRRPPRPEDRQHSAQCPGVRDRARPDIRQGGLFVFLHAAHPTPNPMIHLSPSPPSDP